MRLAMSKTRLAGIMCTPMKRDARRTRWDDHRARWGRRRSTHAERTHAQRCGRSCPRNVHHILLVLLVLLLTRFLRRHVRHSYERPLWRRRVMCKWKRRVVGCIRQQRCMPSVTGSSAERSTRDGHRSTIRRIRAAVTVCSARSDRFVTPAGCRTRTQCSPQRRATIIRTVSVHHARSYHAIMDWELSGLASADTCADAKVQHGGKTDERGCTYDGDDDVLGGRFGT